MKVARLYHSRGLRQNEIAERLQTSQTSVSRLLQQAQDLGIIRTTVVVPPGLNNDLEEEIEERYGLAECHVIDTMSDDDTELTVDLGDAMASIFAASWSIPVKILGYTSWSRTMRSMVASLQPVRGQTPRVVEMLGDLGPPTLQHEAARSTQRLAELAGGEPVFLRAPGVSSSPDVRQALLDQDLHARRALRLLDAIDLALVGIGPLKVVSPLKPGDTYFTQKQFDHARAQGAVGQICLRFIDADGRPVATDLDDLLIGVTFKQLHAARHRWAAAGGPSKYAAIHAALMGAWLDTLVLDTRTAEYLADLPRAGSVDVRAQKTGGGRIRKKQTGGVGSGRRRPSGHGIASSPS